MKHIGNNALHVRGDVPFFLLRQIADQDRLAEFDDDVLSLYKRHVIFKNIVRVGNGHRYDRASGTLGDLEASLLEFEQLAAVVARAFWENTEHFTAPYNFNSIIQRILIPYTTHNRKTIQTSYSFIKQWIFKKLCFLKMHMA